MSSFPDYEAAVNELASWLVQRQGIADYHEAARAIVDAALGDEPLNVINRMRLAELKAIPYPLVPEALTMLDEERVLIQVWPKEVSDEGD